MALDAARGICFLHGASVVHRYAFNNWRNLSVLAKLGQQCLVSPQRHQAQQLSGRTRWNRKSSRFRVVNIFGCCVWAAGQRSCEGHPSLLCTGTTARAVRTPGRGCLCFWSCPMGNVYQEQASRAQRKFLQGSDPFCFIKYTTMILAVRRKIFWTLLLRNSELGKDNFYFDTKRAGILS
eukprot:SAG31_NODE_522_length_14623_cov_6.071674_5_plen_179_part_00